MTRAMKRTVVSSVIAVSAALVALLMAIMLTKFAEAAPLVTTSSTTKGTFAPMSRLVEAFSDFAGSAPNAQSLSEGLRNSSRIKLVDRNNVTTTFIPVTKPMSWDDVRIALSLARAELGSGDISSPTPSDIEAVLNGGTAGTGDLMINFTGVLTQRASGLGWDQIARAHSFELDMLTRGTSKAVAESDEDTSVPSMSPVSTAKKPPKKQAKAQPRAQP
jgi:hypothetical protein